MRIDNECVRNILFTIEENSSFGQPCCMENFQEYPKLGNYEKDKIAYHLRYLRMKGLIFDFSSEKLTSHYDLMPEGHEFLANIRDENNWNKIKGISSSIGFASLKIISAIAEGVATAAINQRLGFSE